MFKYKLNTIILLSILLLLGCKKEPVFLKIDSNKINLELKKNSEIDFKNWHFKDIELDTIPGISLNRAYDSLLIGKKRNNVIVAVIDTEIDVNHENFKNLIWKNFNEIPNNNIDDDGNGYVDDINGWNFLGNNKGENNKFVNYEYTRILRKFNPIFQGKNISEINSKDSLDFIIYTRAKKKYNDRNNEAKEDLDYINMVSKSKSDAENELSKYFLSENYTINDLDSLKKLYPKNKVLQEKILIKSNFIKYKFTDSYIIYYKFKAEERINKTLNLNYDDRSIQGDNPLDITDVKYGNNILNKNVKFLDHGTKMAGIISNIGLKNELKILPLAISSFGDEHDKDIALAIRYAVNNGAKVINMSFGKEFSLNKKWIFDAIKYAEEKNVIIISSAGNYGYNLDFNTYYPNDNIDMKEISDNFMLIGATSYSLSQKLKRKSSNYGKIDVDVFAPGYKIFTTYPHNEYINNSAGTSAASAITSGVAALIYSYYPSLTASQVKHILMDSGLEYTIEVSTPTKEDKSKTTPFNQLSKSGKVLNAYNAFIMADSISRN